MLQQPRRERFETISIPTKVMALFEYKKQEKIKAIGAGGKLPYLPSWEHNTQLQGLNINSLEGTERKEKLGSPAYVRNSFDCLELNDGDARAECLWERIREKANQVDILVGICHRPPNQNQVAEEILYKQLTEDSQLLALVLMEVFNLADVFWKYSRELVQEVPADYGR